MAVATQAIGSIELRDLEILSASYGREFLPYPFMRCMASSFKTRDEFEEYAATVPKRFADGDLKMFQDWAGTYVSADIRVECYVRNVGEPEKSIRILAHRWNDSGYLASQRGGADTVDVFALSPYELGSAIAERSGTTTSGRHPAIIVDGLGKIDTPPVWTGGYSSVNDRVSVALSPNSVPKSSVAVLASVQAHWRPTRAWGIDRGKDGVIWIHVDRDGDYIYGPTYEEANPMSVRILSERIDRLIATDIALLKAFRNG